MTDPYDYPDFDYYDTQADLTAEAAEYNLNAAHSNDDGWFYNDDNDDEVSSSDDFG